MVVLAELERLMDWSQFFSAPFFPMQRPDTSQENVRFRTASPLVNITDQDIDRAMSIGMAAGTGIEGGGNVPVETIVGPAVKYRGQIYTGPNHVAAIESAARAHNLPFRRTVDRNAAIDAMEDTEGFLTSAGRYIDRREAMGIANGANQLKSPPTEDVLWAQDLKK